MSAGSSIQASRKTVAVDLNPATREVATGTEVYAREVGSRLPGAAPDLRWLFFGSRARHPIWLARQVPHRGPRPRVRAAPFGLLPGRAFVSPAHDTMGSASVPAPDHPFRIHPQRPRRPVSRRPGAGAGGAAGRWR